jgi:hypothetical protein
MIVQVCGEDDVGVGADIDGAIVVVVLGDHDPLESDKLLFQVMSNCLFLLPNEGGGTLLCIGLVQGLATDSHDDDHSLLFSLCGSHDILLLPLSDGGGNLLLINRGVGGAARYGRKDGGV